MHQRLHLRLKALEKWLPDETKPHKAPLPEWLMEDLRQQGIRFDASGRPEKNSRAESQAALFNDLLHLAEAFLKTYTAAIRCRAAG
jgi:hypothetical protein